MRVLFLEKATRSGHTGYVAILDTVAIAPSDGLLLRNPATEGLPTILSESLHTAAVCRLSRMTDYSKANCLQAGVVKALHGSFAHNGTSWLVTRDTGFHRFLSFRARSLRNQPPRLEILPARGPAPGDPRVGSTKFRRRM